MTEYQIQPNSKRCSVSGRELRPGERYYSVLLDQAGAFVRQDFSAEVWTGPPEGAFSFWMGRVPSGDEKQRPRFDDDLLLDCFHRLEGQTDPARVNFRYVLALLLMRRKRMKFEETVLENGAEHLALKCTRTGEKHLVLNPQLSEDEMVQVQEEVVKVLGWD
jgi:hypothetical protein